MCLNASELVNESCQPLPAGSDPLSASEVHDLSHELDEGWAVENGELVRTVSFANYYETMAFVNAVAWIAHREDHHPELTVGYSTCRIAYATHSVGGLTRNDFICAAKVDALD
jgi:4a-hydroxytetrahydrobiopterin dehydratase